MVLLGRSNLLGALFVRKPYVPRVSNRVTAPHVAVSSLFRAQRKQLPPTVCQATDGGDDAPSTVEEIREHVGGMSIGEIRLELQRRGLPSGGGQAIVMDRLFKAMRTSSEPVLLIDTIDPEIITTLEGLVFSKLLHIRQVLRIPMTGRKKADLVAVLGGVAQERGLDYLLETLATYERGGVKVEGGSETTEGGTDHTEDGAENTRVKEDLDPNMVVVFEAMTSSAVAKLSRNHNLPYQNVKKDVMAVGLARLASRIGLEAVLGDSAFVASAALGGSAQAEAGGGDFSADTDVELGDSMDASGGIDPVMIKAELRNMSRAELVDVLESKEADTEGTDEELIDRLAIIIAVEVENELMETQQNTKGRRPISSEQVDQLVERLSAQMYSFFVTNTRPALFSELKSMGIDAPYSTKNELASKMSDVKARQEMETLVEASKTDPIVAAELWEQLDLIAQEAKGGGDDDEIEEPAMQEAVDLDQIQSKEDTITLPSFQIAKMRVHDMREILGRLGLSTEGSSYDMRERLVELRNEERAANLARSSSQKYKVKVMPLRDLRSQLATWRKSTSGSREQLENRFLEVLAELEPTAAADKDGEPSEGEEDYSSFDGPNAYLDDTLDLRPIRRDPNLEVVVLCGAPMGTLGMAQQSLDAARAILDTLYTAPLPLLGQLRGTDAYIEGLKARIADMQETAAEMESADAAAAQGSEPIADLTDADGDADGDAAEGEEGEEGEDEESDVAVSGDGDEEDWRHEASGIAVHVLYVDSSMRVHMMRPKDVLSTTATLLEAGYGEHFILADHKELISKLQLGGNKIVLPAFVGPNAVPSAGSAYVSSAIGRQHEEALAELHAALGDLDNVQLLCSTSPEALALAGDKWACGQKLRELGYPTVPAFRVTLDQLSSADLAEEDEDEDVAEDADVVAADELEDAAAELAEGAAWVQDMKAWCLQMGWEPTYRHFVVKPTCGAHGQGVIPVRGLGGAVVAARKLLKNMQQAGGAGSSSAAVLVEPFMGRKAIEFSCTVIEAPGGEALALMPSEIEIYDIERTIFESEVDRAEWNLLRTGAGPEEVDWEVEKIRSSALPHPEFGLFVPSRKYLPTQVVKYHCPPRLSRKMTHHIRHAAAKLFSQLGLHGAARVDGWVAMDPDWKGLHEPDLMDIRILPDYDPIIVAKFEEQQEMAFRRDPCPLKDYYDYWDHHCADLDKFDPATRLESATNGEGTIFIADVNVHGTVAVDLGPGSLALHQAAEVGLSASGLMRCYLNTALERQYNTAAEAKAKNAIDTVEEGEEEAEIEFLEGPSLTDAWSSALMNHIVPESWDLQKLLWEDTKEMDMLQMVDDLEEEAEDREIFELADELLDMVPEALDTYHPEGLKPLVDLVDADPSWEEGHEDEEEEEEEEEGGDDDDEASFIAYPEALMDGEEILWHEQAEAQAELLADEYDEDEEEGELEEGEERVLAVGDIEDELLEAGELELDLYEQFRFNSGGWKPDLSDERSQNEKHEQRLWEEEQNPPYTDVDALRAKYPDLPEDELMWLMLGVTGDGSVINRQATVLQMRTQRAANKKRGDINMYAAATSAYTDAAFEDIEGEGEEEEEDEGELAEDEQEDEGEEGEDGEDGEAGKGEMEEPEIPESLPSLAADIDVPGRPHKIWVLMGGDPNMSDASVRSGLNVVRKLQQFMDLQVDAFLMVPPGAGHDEERRRTNLLRRRNELLSIGSTEEELLESMTLKELRNMPHLDTSVETEYVWALPAAHTMYHSSASVLDACERSLRLNNKSQYALDPLERQAQQVRQDVQAELAAGGVAGVAGLWGGDPATLPIPPRLLSLDQFAEEAEDRGVTVFMAMQGGLAQDGTVQQWLDAFSVPYTGSGAVANLSCHDKLTLPEVLFQLQALGVATIPNRMVGNGILEDIAQSEEYAQTIFVTLRLELELDGGPKDEPLHIKPSMLGTAMAAVKLNTPNDLMLFSQAAVSGTPFIPAGSLSYPHDNIAMPKYTPPFYMVEPYIPADPVFVRPAASVDPTYPISGAEVICDSKSNWLEVSIGLLGVMGRVDAMGVSVLAHLLPPAVPGEASLPPVATAAARMYLTPAPTELVSEEALAEALARAEAVADLLKICGMARVDAFMHAVTGQLIVLEVETLPDLGPDSVLYQQALHPYDGSVPLYPHELLRAMVGMAKDGAAAINAADTEFLENAPGEQEELAEEDMEDTEDVEYDLGSLPVGGRGGGEDDEYYGMSSATSEAYAAEGGKFNDSTREDYDSWDFSGKGSIIDNE